MQGLGKHKGTYWTNESKATSSKDEFIPPQGGLVERDEEGEAKEEQERGGEHHKLWVQLPVQCQRMMFYGGIWKRNRLKIAGYP